MWFRTSKHPSLSSVVFDTTGYHDLGVHEGKHVWHTAQGDGIGLFFFPIKPDLPPNARSAEDLRQFYSSLLTGAVGELVELRLPKVDGQRSVATIIKVSQQSSGMTYVGSITIPFRDFSFVLKAQCEEHGTTGIREATILNGMLANSDVVLNDSGFPVGFSPDDPQFDGQFPNHPLSRVRCVLQHIEASLRLNATLKRMPSFGLPEESAE